MDSLIEPSSLNGIKPDTLHLERQSLVARARRACTISRGGGGAGGGGGGGNPNSFFQKKPLRGMVRPSDDRSSGSGGKSTLDVMAGLERPDSGEVVVNGTPFNALEEDAMATASRPPGRHDSVVSFDSTMDGAGKCRRTLWSGRRAMASRRAEQNDHRSVCGPLHHYPTQLSGGEQQRVALDRAWAARSSILVLRAPPAISPRPPAKQIRRYASPSHVERGCAVLVRTTHGAGANAANACAVRSGG